MFSKKGFKADFKRLAEVSSLGLMLPSSIIVGLFIGYILDKVIKTHPWMLLIFTLLGIVSGLYSLIRGLNKISKDEGHPKMRNNK